MTDTPDLIPLSALQHYSYCPRQCALIHQEQTFMDNVFTVRGNLVHERVDTPGVRHEDGVEVHTAVPLVHEALGLIGKADVVERWPDGRLCPVEYKHGPRRQHDHDDLQVAVQALCLEAMTGQSLTEGAVYHYSSRRRRVVPITPALREAVAVTARRVHDLLRSAQMPPPVADASRCRGCSLVDACQPDLLNAASTLRQLADTLFDPEEDTP